MNLTRRSALLASVVSALAPFLPKAGLAKPQAVDLPVFRAGTRSGLPFTGQLGFVEDPLGSGPRWVVFNGQRWQGLGLLNEDCQPIDEAATIHYEDPQRIGSKLGVGHLGRSDWSPGAGRETAS